jgi:glycosyltransferase involved in cell wall biosynthesis
MYNNIKQTSPYISVIIPVYNDAQRLRLCLAALENQSYPKYSYEVIVIDNNSTDNVKELVNSFSQAIYAFEKTTGSYAARNKGISLAKGEVLAFTDSDCIPALHWLEEGIKPILEGSADLVGGRVEFYFQNKNSAAELYDSITFLNTKKATENGVCQTANLFVKKNLFKNIGLFPDCEEGDDIAWTRHATTNGFVLSYQDKSIVKHPARKLRPLLHKFYRVGKGTIPWLKNVNTPAKKIMLYILRDSIPPKWSTLKRKIENHNLRVSKIMFVKMWLIAVLWKVIRLFGILSSLIKQRST